MVHFFNYSTWEAGRDRWISVSLRPAWSTKWILGQPELHSETLSCKTTTTKIAKNLYASVSIWVFVHVCVYMFVSFWVRVCVCVCVCVCVHVWVFVQMCVSLWRPEEEVGSLGTGVAGSCELPSMTKQQVLLTVLDSCCFLRQSPPECCDHNYIHHTYLITDFNG